ncbi:MAG: hypothetical protein AAFO04_24020 [Cyanobacteria bacterium J06592_8]
MADFTDAYGVWFDLGTLSAFPNWQIFDRPCQQGVLFRFTFLANWSDWKDRKGFRSWAWFRFVHHDDSGGFTVVEPSFRLYPKEQQMLKEMPILSRLELNPYTIRKASFKQVIDYRSKPSISAVNPGVSVPVLDWSLKVEYMDEG